MYMTSSMPEHLERHSQRRQQQQTCRSFSHSIQRSLQRSKRAISICLGVIRRTEYNFNLTFQNLVSSSILSIHQYLGAVLSSSLDASGSWDLMLVFTAKWHSIPAIRFSSSSMDLWKQWTSSLHDCYRLGTI